MTSAESSEDAAAAGTSSRDRIVRFRVLAFAGTAVSFLVSQVGLLWVLASGGVGSSPSVPAVVWLVATLCTALFLVAVGDSYRGHPRWLPAPRTAMRPDARDPTE